MSIAVNDQGFSRLFYSLGSLRERKDITMTCSLHGRVSECHDDSGCSGVFSFFPSRLKKKKKEREKRGSFISWKLNSSRLPILVLCPHKLTHVL